MKIEIKHTHYIKTLFSHECEDNSFALTLAAAMQAQADLTGAYLSGVDLRGANLKYIKLREADLSGADLIKTDLWGAQISNANISEANLSGAKLTASLFHSSLQGADLSSADLSHAGLDYAYLDYANLSNANLAGARLIGVDLTGADLTGANLTEANLTEAMLNDTNLRMANLDPIRDDVWAVLSSAPSEVPALIHALKQGKINASIYKDESLQLADIIVIERNYLYRELDELESEKPEFSRAAQRFFKGISLGSTPQTNLVAELALEWCEEWMRRN